MNTEAQNTKRIEKVVGCIRKPNGKMEEYRLPDVEIELDVVYQIDMSGGHASPIFRPYRFREGFFNIIDTLRAKRHKTRKERKALETNEELLRRFVFGLAITKQNYPDLPQGIRL